VESVSEGEEDEDGGVETFEWVAAGMKGVDVDREGVRIGVVMVAPKLFPSSLL
jgi:hypothetical protein